MDPAADLEGDLRRAITGAGMSLNRLGREAGIDPAQLSRFVRGTRTLTLKAAARVCARLSLRLVGAEQPEKE